MRKTLSLLAVVLMTAFVAFAGEVTISMADQGYENAAELTTLTVQGVTLTFDVNTGKTTPKYYEANNDARIYAEGQLTVSAEQPITKMVFTLQLNKSTLTLEKIDVNTGEATVDAEAKTLTWTGAAKEVVFTVPSEKLSDGKTNPQFRFSEVVVTLDGEVVIPEVKDPNLLSYTADEFKYTEAGIWESLFVDGAYTSGNFTLAHYGTTEGLATWNGFAPSIAVKEGEGAYEYYSCVAKGGVKGEGTPYTLAYWSAYDASTYPCTITFAKKSVAEEVYFCNATQTHKDIVEGDYTGYVMKENDYVVVKVRGIAAIEEGAYTLTENSVDYYLADFRDGKSFVNEGWEKCELAALGEVYGLVFDMASTAVGDYGINTSTYFALDQLKIKEAEEPVSSELAFNYGQAVYMNNYLEYIEQPAEKPTWEIGLADFTTDDDYTAWAAFTIVAASAEEVAGTYDLSESEYAEIELVNGTDTTTVELVSGTVKLEFVSKEDYSALVGEEFYIYTYKVEFAAKDADGNDYTFSGTIDDFYYADAMEMIDDEEPISVAEALEIVAETGETATEEDYAVLGYVVKMKYTWDAEHGSATFWIDDTPAESEALYAYSVKPETEADQAVKVGDLVIVTGPLVNYKGNTPEINRGTYTIVEIGTGLEIVDAAELVRVMNGQLVVNATGNVQVYNVNGQLIYNARVNGQATIAAQQGQVLVVRVNDKVAKVVL